MTSKIVQICYIVLRKYQVQTIFEKGFDNEKYNEAIELINRIDWKKYK